MKVLASIPSVTVLGVSPTVSSMRPLRGYVPPKLSPESRPYWHQAFQDEGVQLDMARKTVKEAWFALIQHFYMLCEENNIKPIVSRDDVINDAVRRMLMHRRQALRIYMRRAKLFENTVIVPNGQKHTWKFLPNGNLLLTATIKLEHDGIPAIRARVQGKYAKMFWSSFDTAWSYAVLPNLRVSVRNLTRNRFTLAYTLEIRAPFFIPEDKTKQADKKAYLDRQFFFPMIRGLRFDNVKRRIRF